jgi:cell wall-associated NlpC family hydrolase
MRQRSHIWLLTVSLVLVAFAVGCRPAPAPPPPKSKPNPAAAVAFAEAQVGKPYCTAGTGPTCFDCSGLTSKAWAFGHLAIPRTSGDQFGAFPRVALSELQPGDLVFNSDPSQHVGIYVGSGLIVHATRPGSVVKKVTLTAASIIYAVRPG